MKFFEANQTDSLLQTLFKMALHAMMRKLKMISGLLQKIAFIAIMWNPESNCTCRERILSHSTEVHRRYQNNTYVTGCIVGKNIFDDYWNVDGERESSDAFIDRLHNIHFIE